MSQTIMIVNDDPAWISQICDVASSIDIEISLEVTRSAESFAARLRMPHPSALVTDLSLPWENGFAIARRCRDAGFACPLIMLTAVGDEECAVNALKIGFHDYISTASFWQPLLVKALESALLGLPSPVSEAS